MRRISLSLSFSLGMKWPQKSHLHCPITNRTELTCSVRVMFFTGVCLFTGGVSASGPRGVEDTLLGRHPPGRHTPLGRHLPLARHPSGQTPPWTDTPLRSACWDTVNKQPVRIPLECIIVSVFLLFTTATSLLMAHLHCRRQTGMRIQTQIPVLYRSRVGIQVWVFAMCTCCAQCNVTIGFGI